MKIWFALICGLIQGLAEFLPISSSGHLSLFQNFFGMQDVETNYFTFDIILHLATLIAVFIVYYKDIFPLVPAFFRVIKKLFQRKFKLADYDKNERMVIMVIIATIPLAIALFINDYLEVVKSSSVIIGCILIVNASILFISDKLARGGVNQENAKPRNAIVVGFCQLLATLPGLSRSGSTITGGLTQGFDREFAVKFSFIMSIPAILGANLMNVFDIAENPIPQSDILPIALGAVVALLSGIAAMKLLIYISRKSNFRIFSYYCFAVGTLAIILGALGITFA